jgi:hypothetical protein
MATRKKKSESLVDTIGVPKKAIAGKWSKIEIGTHLTVTKYENGVVTMEWDDDQLLKEVKAAIASVEKK